MTTSNLDIEALAKLMRVKLTVCLQDDLAQMTPQAGMNYVINYGNEANGGTHWVCLILDDDGDEAVFIDSFGTHYSTDVEEFMKRTPGSVVKLGFSNVILQSLESSLCGWYCIAAITFAHRSTNVSLFEAMAEFTRHFRADARANAPILRHMVTNQLRGAQLPAKLRAKLYEKISP
jgi:hypothetical protein